MFTVTLPAGTEVLRPQSEVKARAGASGTCKQWGCLHMRSSKRYTVNIALSYLAELGNALWKGGITFRSMSTTSTHTLPPRHPLFTLTLALTPHPHPLCHQGIPYPQSHAFSHSPQPRIATEASLTHPYPHTHTHPATKASLTKPVLVEGFDAAVNTSSSMRTKSSLHV
eukprot:1155282-Pelagomonas_calceolata.AAC.10